jgi:hypothetical protein
MAQQAPPRRASFWSPWLRSPRTTSKRRAPIQRGGTPAPSPPLVQRHQLPRKEEVMGIGIGGLVVIIILVVLFVL